MAHAVQGKTFERRYIKTFGLSCKVLWCILHKKGVGPPPAEQNVMPIICLMYKADAVETLLKILQKMMWIKKLSAMTCAATIIAALRDSWKASIPILTDYRQTFLFV